MKIFVTGAAGYIGAHTVLELLNSGHQVFAFDNLSNSSLLSLKRVETITNKKIGFSKGDVRDTNHLTIELEKFKPEAVIHFAALKSVTESFKKPLEYYDVNVNGSLSLLESMSKVNCRTVIFSSSATVYGNPEYLPIDETHPTIPINPYGRTKFMVERILQDWVNSGSTEQAICLRYFNPVGAHETGLKGKKTDTASGNLMPIIVEVASGRLPHLNIFGDNYPTRDGTGERDYIHVSDLAIFHQKAVEKISMLERFEVLNIGTGKGTTVKELVKAFENANNIEVPIKISKRRSGDVASSWTSTKKAERKLGYKSSRSINEACKDEWVSKNALS